MAVVSTVSESNIEFDFTEGQVIESFKSINELWKQNYLCDVVINVKNQRIAAHKLVLAASIPYFHAMFTSGLKEVLDSEVTLNGMDPDAVKTVITFAYTACLCVNEKNVQSLLPVACILQLSPAITACCEFLESQLDASNCLGICSFAELHECHLLNEEAKKYCDRYFTRVVNHEEFLQLSVDKLINYLKRDGLCVKSESEIFMAAIKWICHDEIHRISFADKIFAVIRVNLLPKSFIESIATGDIDKKPLSIDMQQAIICIFKDYGWLIQRSTNPRFLGEQLLLINSTSMPNHKMRCPVDSLVIFSSGGYLKHSLSTLECFDTRTKTWTEYAEMRQPKSGSGAAFVGGSFYVIGGRNNSIYGNVDLDCVDCYDPFINQWREVARLSVPRNRLGVGVIGSRIYAIGGSDGMIHLDSAEYYDLECDRWITIPSMKTRRIGVGVAVIGNNLYAVGGYDGENRLQSVECYSMATDSWRFVSSTNTPRSGAGVATIGNYMYAVGGYNGIAQLNSAERYDPTLDEWTLVSPMNYRRSALNVAVLRDKLYALGGYDGERFLSSIEVYNPEDDSWSFVSDMMVGRSGAAVAVGTKPLL